MGGGGAENQLIQIAKEQMKNGVDVHVLLLRRGANFDSLVNTKVTIHLLEDWHHYNLAIAFKICRVIKKLRPDIVQSWLQYMDIMSGIATMIDGGPKWILSERNSEYSFQLKKLVRRFIGSFADLVIANSNKGKDYWEEFPLYKNEAIQIPNGYDFSSFQEVSNSSISEEVEKLKPYILYIGRYEKQKNLENLFKALPYILSKFDINLLCFGKGTLKNNLIQLSQSLNISERVQINGYTDHVNFLMQNAFLFVSVSTHEGMPNTVVEAILNNCPLVISDIPEHRDIVNNEHCIFVNPKDVKSIGIGLEKMIKKRKYYKNISMEVNHWDIKQVANLYLENYNKLLNNERN